MVDWFNDQLKLWVHKSVEQCAGLFSRKLRVQVKRYLKACAHHGIVVEQLNGRRRCSIICSSVRMFRRKNRMECEAITLKTQSSRAEKLNREE